MRDEMGWPLSQEIGTRTALREAVPDLTRSGDWICLNVSPTTSWPVRAQSLVFAGQTIWIIPITQEEHPGVALERSAGLSIEDAEAVLYRLLSVIAWREDTGIHVAHRTGGSWPMMMGLDRQRGFSTRQPFDFTETICPEEQGPRIALGLMREGRSLNHPGYAFLSFWRVLELAMPVASERTEWMQAVLPTLKGHDVPGALEGIRALGVEDVGRHLFSSGRCAIAHASGDPIVNPDDPRDARRLSSELPLVRELAVRAIEDCFGIDSRSKEYREHLYELRGWRRFIGAAAIDRIIAETPPGDGETINLPQICVRIRGRPRYEAFEGMEPSEARISDGLLHLEYRSPDRLTAIRFALAFAAEHLAFDLAKGILHADDGSAAAAEHLVGLHRFSRDLLLNGELQIWDADDGTLLSRLDAFIPTNCHVDLDACDALVAEAQAEADRRRVTSGDA